MTEAGRRRIQVVYTTTLSTFVKRDIEMLSKHHEVVPRFSNGFLGFVKAVIGVRKSDASLLWFATMTSAAVALFARLLGKPTILVLGGADVASLPEYNYGLLARPFYRIFPMVAIVSATSVLAVDEGLIEDVRNNTGIDRADVRVLPTGYDSDRFKPVGEKKRTVLTVCSGSTWDRLRIKGVDTFLEVSKRMPDVQFRIIGLHGKVADEVKAMAKGNLVIEGELPENEVLKRMQEAKVYCQFSVREGLPNALCEAMLCECVAVGTDVQGVRTAIGDVGFLVPYSDAAQAAEAVRKALDSDAGAACRKRIAERFSADAREAGLNEELDRLETKGGEGR